MFARAKKRLRFTSINRIGYLWSTGDSHKEYYRKRCGASYTVNTGGCISDPTVVTLYVVLIHLILLPEYYSQQQLH
jgi:hypothetical protein